MYVEFYVRRKRIVLLRIRIIKGNAVIFIYELFLKKM